MICTKENSVEFRADLKDYAPDFYLLAKKLYEHGFIEGLRGISLDIGPFTEESTSETNQPQQVAVEEHCINCAKFSKDTIGDGYGVGKCLLNIRPDEIKWASTIACKKFFITTDTEVML